MTDSKHFNPGSRPQLEDISDRPIRTWAAVAQARVRMKAETLVLLVAGEIPSGDVLAVASIGGVLGAKHCQAVIPVKHPQMIAQAKVEFGIDSLRSSVDILARVKSVGATSVAAEALAASFAAALTIFDMCRSFDDEIAIEYVKLVSESYIDSSNSSAVSEPSSQIGATVQAAEEPVQSRRLRVVSKTDPVVRLPKLKSKSKAKPKAKAKLKPKAKARAKSKPKVKARAKTKAKPKVKVRAKAKPKPKTKVKAKAKTPGKSRRKTKRNVKGR
jgi:cyclic pyranopterin phosphate synthase